jgi:hypothetical protein
MSNTCNSDSIRQRSDLRALDNHESWRGVYALLDVEPSIEPELTNSGAAAVHEEYTQ